MKNTAHKVILGKNENSQDYVANLDGNMLLVGTVGAGKSVLCKNLVKQLSSYPDVKVAYFDPKMVEYAKVKNNPNTVLPVGNTDDAMKELIHNIRRLAKTDYTLYVIVDEYLDIYAARKELRELIEAKKENIHFLVCMQHPEKRILSPKFMSSFAYVGIMNMLYKEDYEMVYPFDKTPELKGCGDYLLAEGDRITHLQAEK